MKCTYATDFVNPDRDVYITWHTKGFPHLHNHDYWEFFLISEGRLKHTCNDFEEVLESGDLRLMRPDDNHRFDLFPNCIGTHINIMIKVECFENLINFMKPGLLEIIVRHPFPPKLFLNGVSFHWMMEHIHKIHLLNDNEEAEKSAFIKMVFANMLQLLAESMRFENFNYPDWLNAFIKQIQEPDNLCKDVEELYQLANFSRGHLYRLFKKHTGQVLSEYIRELKLTYAANLIENTNYSLVYIANQVGYSSFSHFLRIFKQRFNVSPTDYRRRVSQFGGFAE